LINTTQPDENLFTKKDRLEQMLRTYAPYIDILSAHTFKLMSAGKNYNKFCCLLLSVLYEDEDNFKWIQIADYLLWRLMVINKIFKPENKN